MMRPHPLRWWRNWWQHCKMLLFYSQFIAPGDLAFDACAYVGNRTRVFLQLGARVVAVEPQKKNARGLFIKFHSNPNSFLVNQALGATAGMSEFFEDQCLRGLSQPVLALSFEFQPIF